MSKNKRSYSIILAIVSFVFFGTFIFIHYYESDNDYIARKQQMISGAGWDGFIYEKYGLFYQHSRIGTYIKSDSLADALDRFSKIQNKPNSVTILIPPGAKLDDERIFKNLFIAQNRNMNAVNIEKIATSKDGSFYIEYRIN